MERRKICRYFQRGACRKDNCPFVHLKQNRKTCNFYLQGNCRKGNACNFYHPPKQQEKLANLKQQLKQKKQKKYQKPQQCSQEQVQQDKHQTEQINVEKQQVQFQKQQQKQEVDQQTKNQGLISQKRLQSNQKIAKINFLLGLNEDSSSQQQQQYFQQKNQPQIQKIQFVKQYPKKFPDFSKTQQIKLLVKQKQLKYFKQQKYIDFINKITDLKQKEHYQIIRKFTDSFEQINQNLYHYKIKIRPLLYQKQINLHFQMKQDTINLQIDSSKYPQEKASIMITNQSIPQQYRLKFGQILNKYHLINTLFITLKYLLNNFQKIYKQAHFKLQNEHYSRIQLQKKLKQKINNQTQQITDKPKKKNIKKIKEDMNPDLKKLNIPQGQKIDNIFYNYQISVQSIILQNCQYLVLQKALIYLQCVCQKKLMYIFDMQKDRSLKYNQKLLCKKCNNIILLGIQRQVIQYKKNILGHFGVTSAHIIDIGGIGVKIGCLCNNQISKGKLYLPGQRISANCHNCFQSMHVTFLGLKIFNPTLKTIQIVSDKQLPNKGACKHLKFSFRWFRFGCCGRCFSCDDCHIIQSVALHEKIKGITMLCGFCSRQQNVANDCCFCHKNLVKGIDKSGHWQGGMGCRDQTLLSKKDGKKYSGLTKRKEK